MTILKDQKYYPGFLFFFDFPFPITQGKKILWIKILYNFFQNMYVYSKKIVKIYFSKSDHEIHNLMQSILTLHHP